MLSELDLDFVPLSQPRKPRRDAISHVSEDLDPVFELNPKQTVGEGLDDGPFDQVRTAGHERRLYQFEFTLVLFLAVRTTGPSAVMATVCSK